MTNPHDHDLPPLIEVRGLSFAREDEPIFGPLDFRVDSGSALAIEGGNGAGKTTLIRVLAGLLAPGAGSVLWRGALLGHQLGLKPDLTPLEHLRFRAALEGVRPGITPAAALRSVGLEGYETLPVRMLSAGQRKRTALAVLLLSTASLWLLDEPYANLDREGQVLVDRMLETHCRRDGAAILTSHGLVSPGVSRLTTITLRGSRP
jgi:heme exporter protein A